MATSTGRWATGVVALLWAVTLMLPMSGSALTDAGTRWMIDESVVLVGGQPAYLAHLPAVGSAVLVRGGAPSGSRSVVYVEGVDYDLDRAEGALRRRAGSRIPDWRGHPFYGANDFDHKRAAEEGFSSSPFLLSVDYAYVPDPGWPRQADQRPWLARSRAKLAAGGPFTMVALGDSITEGADASQPSRVFWRRYAAQLSERYPAARITAVGVATQGDTTRVGLARWASGVLPERPDLVLVAFGMNDHILGGIEPAEFEANLVELVRRIRSGTRADVVLVSTFPPNPRWHFASHRMGEYAAATARAADAAGCAYADVYHNWLSETARKKPEDLLANAVNHPTDYGHWIYAQVLAALGL